MTTTCGGGAILPRPTRSLTGRQTVRGLAVRVKAMVRLLNLEDTMSDTPSRSLAARAREASNDPLLSIGEAWNLLWDCANRLDSMQRTAQSRNRTIRRMRRTISRIESRRKPSA